MGRCLLCGKEANLPYEVEELDIRLYTIEELCYYIYHNLPLLGDDFISDRLLYFIRDELDLPEIADKIVRFYSSPSDQDSTLLMLLSEVGYYTDYELQDFQARLVYRRRKNGPERVYAKAESLLEKRRYQGAIRNFKSLLSGPRDGRVGRDFYASVYEGVANCYGCLSQFDRAVEYLGYAYEERKSERLLKKMYDVSVLSGTEPPEAYFSKVSAEHLSSWQQDYWNRETVARDRTGGSTDLQIFLHDPDRAKEELLRYVEQKKEEYRGMLE